ncbi:TPR end-of-group domain-containing protein, partial [Rivihabitans pingtungensis]|uniref:TPR end-of-group domain-containing protein n=1 Tax=Rivihabitans pingtungensis TaxID=1054498 RepID=UPI002FD9F370
GSEHALAAACALWRQAGELYAQALAIKPDLYQATLGWSIALLQESQAIHDTHPDQAAALLNQAEALLLQAEAGQPGLAAYNLACIAALCHRPADAIHWLRSCQTHGTLPSEEHFRTDSNLDPIRDTPEFTAWWAEVFGRGDAAMG